jgi:hypothetical protein
VAEGTAEEAVGTAEMFSDDFVVVIGVEILDLRDSWKWHTEKWLLGVRGAWLGIGC